MLLFFIMSHFLLEFVFNASENEISDKMFLIFLSAKKHLLHILFLSVHIFFKLVFNTSENEVPHKIP
jgi:hypothetical protein